MFYWYLHQGIGVGLGILGLVLGIGQGFRTHTQDKLIEKSVSLRLQARIRRIQDARLTM